MAEKVCRVGQALIKGLRAVIPVVQDPPREWVRKLAFWMALLVFVGAGYYLLDEVWWQPKNVQDTAGTLRDWFHAEDVVLPEAETDTTVYPENMLPSFKRLYRANPDVRGWLTFTAGEGNADLFEGTIDNPVTQTTDNDYYLNHDFWGERVKAGTLYFDYRNDLNEGASNRNLIIYGHDLNSGLMFSKLNLLATGKTDRAKKLTTLSLNTLYEERTYKVLAVMVVNVKAEDGPVFNYLRTEFGDEQTFLSFVDDIRKRSLYDFGDVDVQEGDELLTLSTCTRKRDTTLEDGRLVVVARRVRAGEDPAVDTNKTTKNADVLMPKAWYINNKLDVPKEYAETTETTTTVTDIITTTTAEEPDTTSTESTTSDATTTTDKTVTVTTTENTTTTTKKGVTTVTTTTKKGVTTTVTAKTTTTKKEKTTTTATTGTTTTVAAATTVSQTTTKADVTTATTKKATTTTVAEDVTTTVAQEPTTTTAQETTTTVTAETTTTTVEEEAATTLEEEPTTEPPTTTTVSDGGEEE